MATTTFNTHTFIKRLKKQGMSEALAEEVANGLAESRELDLTNLVTKDYLDARINQLRVDLIKWQIAIAFIGFSGMTSVIVTILRFYIGK